MAGAQELSKYLLVHTHQDSSAVTQPSWGCSWREQGFLLAPNAYNSVGCKMSWIIQVGEGVLWHSEGFQVTFQTAATSLQPCRLGYTFTGAVQHHLLCHWFQNTEFKHPRERVKLCPRKLLQSNQTESTGLGVTMKWVQVHSRVPLLACAKAERPYRDREAKTILSTRSQ